MLEGMKKRKMYGEKEKKKKVVGLTTDDDDSPKIGRGRGKEKEKKKKIEKFRKPVGMLVGDPRGLEASI